MEENMIQSRRFIEYSFIRKLLIKEISRIMLDKTTMPKSVVNHVLAGRTELFVPLDDLVDSFDQVLLCDSLSSGSDRKHTSFRAHRPELSTSGVGAKSSQKLVSDTFFHWHVLRVDFENVHSAFQVREAKFNLSIDSSWSHEGGVQGVWPVGCHQNLNVSSGFETVHLVDDFKHGSLDFVVASWAVVESGSSDCVNLVKENDTGFLCPCHLEDFSYHSCTLSDVLLDQFWTNNSDERCISSVGNSSGCEGFSSSWRSIQEDTFWWINTEIDKLLRSQKWHLHDFSEFFKLFFAATDVVVGDIGLVFYGHHGDGGIDFGREGHLNHVLLSVNTDSHTFFNVGGWEFFT